MSISFNHEDCNRQCLAYIQQHGFPLYDAADYGVRIVEADVAENETCWRVIGVYHLKPEENRGNHHVYFEVLNEAEQRLTGPHAWAGWTWEGRQPHERADPTPLDKPAHETAGNIPINRAGQIVSVWIKGLSREADEPSDRVENLRTDHPDERAPDGSLGNSIGHHSFYVIFQRTRKGPPAVADGVISGQVLNGQDYTVRLLREQQVVAEQTVGADFSFRFERLPAGTYQLEAIGPTLRQDGITLDADHKAHTVILSVS